MKMLKGALFVFVGLFALITLMSLLIPSKIVVAKSTTVQADSIKLFREISDLKHWLHWHPVFVNDSASIRFSDVTDQVNARATWNSGGKQTSLVITEKKYPTVTVAMQRAGENDVINILSITPVQEEGNMQVQWQSITKLKWYPWEKFSGIFIEKMAGSGYQVALDSLKLYVETH